MFRKQIASKLEKTTVITRHCEGPIEGSLKLLGLSRYYRFEGLKGALNWVPIMPNWGIGSPLCRQTPFSRTADMSFSILGQIDVRLKSPKLFCDWSFDRMILSDLVRSNKIWIVITLFLWVWHQTKFQFGAKPIGKVLLQPIFCLL